MKKSLILLIMMISVFTGCGGKDKVKPSADSLLTTGALDAIEVIRNAYQARDTGTLQSRINAETVDDILSGLDFMEAALSFTPKMVRITPEFIIVSLNWQGTWQTEKVKDLENRGVADLVLQRETTKLMRIEGDNPFLIPSEAESR